MRYGIACTVPSSSRRSTRSWPATRSRRRRCCPCCGRCSGRSGWIEPRAPRTGSRDAARREPGARPRRGDLLHDVQAAAVGTAPHPGLHDALLHAARLGRAARRICEREARHPTRARSRRTASSRCVRVECLGSCGTAPMFQLNDDYHENLTPDAVDAPARPAALKRRPMEHGPHAQRRQGAGSETLDVYEAGRRLPGAAQGAAHDDARRGHRGGEEVRAARPRRRGLPDRPEVVLHAQGDRRSRTTCCATPTSPSRARSRTGC